MSQHVRFEIIEHGSDAYLAGVRLRDEMLRNPMGVVTTEEEMCADFVRSAAPSRWWGRGGRGSHAGG